MLIGALTFLLFYFSSGETGWMLNNLDHLESNLKTVVKEQGVLKNALHVVDKMEKTTKSYADADAENIKTLEGIMQDYDASKMTFQQHLDANYQRRIAFQQQMLALRFTLKETLSRDEWEKLFPVEKKQ